MCLSPRSTSLCTSRGSSPLGAVGGTTALWKGALHFLVAPQPHSQCPRVGHTKGRPGSRFLPKVSGTRATSFGPDSLWKESGTGFLLGWHHHESTTPSRGLLTAASGQMTPSPLSVGKIKTLHTKLILNNE